MDGFRIREIRDNPTLEELKERVDTVDVLFMTIEVSNLKLNLNGNHRLSECAFAESKS